MCNMDETVDLDAIALATSGAVGSRSCEYDQRGSDPGRQERPEGSFPERSVRGSGSRI